MEWRLLLEGAPSASLDLLGFSSRLHNLSFHWPSLGAHRPAGTGTRATPSANRFKGPLHGPRRASRGPPCVPQNRISHVLRHLRGSHLVLHTMPERVVRRLRRVRDAHSFADPLPCHVPPTAATLPMRVQSLVREQRPTALQARPDKSGSPLELPEDGMGTDRRWSLFTLSPGASSWTAMNHTSPSCRMSAAPSCRTSATRIPEKAISHGAQRMDGRVSLRAAWRIRTT